MPRHLITAVPPCASGVEHLGSLAGSMLPADVYARFLRARGEQVLFVCATDEHGASSELAAHEAGLDVSEYCRRRHERRVRLAGDLGLSFDVFGRSSAAQAREQTQYFAQRLDEEGFLEPRSTRQVFSRGDGRFLPDRCIVGTCPHCGSEAARGDQCDGCGRVLKPTELIHARSAISGSRDLELRDSRHLFLLQSKLVGELRAWLSEKSDWPALVRTVGLERLDEGLEDRSITQDLAWGAPVGRQGFDGKVYSAWFDAPIAYIGATREWAAAGSDPDAWRQWWRASDDVRYVQFITGGDVPFHTVCFPCMVIGSGDRWKLVDDLKAFHQLAYDGGDRAGNGNIGVCMDEALKLLPADHWRYYLMANAPEVEDASFSWEAFAVAVNEDLAGTFGDFVRRSLALAALHFGGRVPAGGEPGPPELELLKDLDRLLDAYENRMVAREFRSAVGELRAIWRCGSAYLDRKQPWMSIGGADRGDAELTLRFCVNLACLFARLSAPLMPFAAGRLLDALAAPGSCRGWPSAFRGDELPPTHPFTVPPSLFRRVAEGDVERWRARFGSGG
ncbi:MAG TPA: methionine--tRNA ligase [Solirubrobacterales bacterium]|nr:methionine--tRNA ligase [Solirubrobacterales bacterium]